MSSTLFFDVVPVKKFNITVLDATFRANPNLDFDSGDIIWMMTSSALVFLMIPGTALFSSGISATESALSMIFLPMLTAAVIALQFWGGAESIMLHGVLATPSGNDHGPKIPELVYVLYQCMFACFTAALVSGSVVKKGRFVPFLILICIWPTLIYDPIARWTWCQEGWSNKWGVLDFAGGTAVHICAATTAAAYSGFFRIRARIFRGCGFETTSHELQERSHSPTSARTDATGGQNLETRKAHSMVNVVLGSVLSWVGWFGFNGGSALGANLRAVSACFSTFLAASAGGFSWCFLDYVLLSVEEAILRSARRSSRDSIEIAGSKSPGKFSVLGFCNGAIAGLVAITPAAGYVSCRVSPLFGIAGATACSLCMYGNFISTQLLDILNIFVVHGVGGWVGMIMTGFFARSDIAALDGYSTIEGGWWNHNWKQLGIQVGDALAGMAFAGVGTILILLAMEAVSFAIWKRPMENGDYILDADDILEKELL